MKIGFAPMEKGKQMFKYRLMYGYPEHYVVRESDDLVFLQRVKESVIADAKFYRKAWRIALYQTSPSGYASELFYKQFEDKDFS